MKVGKKIEALAAFKKASEMNYDKKINEDALLQYAKLGFEAGNTDAKVLIFFREYPPSKIFSAVPVFPAIS